MVAANAGGKDVHPMRHAEGENPAKEWPKYQIDIFGHVPEYTITAGGAA
ncbi:MAG TPA: hypothetical protein VNM47_06060 [Terriglobia bacterium]|nr:hypothetical protein [Terriglobia bacterium]